MQGAFHAPAMVRTAHPAILYRRENTPASRATPTSCRRQNGIETGIITKEPLINSLIVIPAHAGIQIFQ